MPVLDDILARDASVQNQRLGQAVHAADWSQTFSGPQSDATLRAQRNVTDLVNSALERKLALAAQTDKNALEIYQKGKELQEWEQQAPLRDQLLRSKISAEGATARFQARRDAETMEQTSRFAEHMENAPKPGTPEYQAHFIQGIKQNPRIVSTQWFKDQAKAIAEEHDALTTLDDITPPEGAEMSSVTFGKKGVQQATFRTPDASDDPLEKEIQKGYGITRGQLQSPFAVRELERKTVNTDGVESTVDEGKRGGSIIEVEVPGKDGEGTRKIKMSRAEYLKFGGKLVEDEPQTDPKKSLAEKALNDPNASEAHKAAARKILGRE